jgi:uncharacterized damage-inducible protein DinB
MSNFEIALAQLRAQRGELRRLTSGLKKEQWDFQPYSQLNSIRSTLVHLLIVDRSAMVKMDDPMNFSWDSMVTDEETKAEPEQLLTLLATSLTNLENYYRQNFQALPLDATVQSFGSDTTVLAALFGLAVEYGYHKGQISYLRLASDAAWVYYSAS